MDRFYSTQLRFQVKLVSIHERPPLVFPWFLTGVGGVRVFGKGNPDGNPPCFPSISRGGVAWNSSDTIESREELPIWYSTPLICCKRRQIQTLYQRAPEIFARELKLWTFSGARIYLIDTKPKENSLNWHFFFWISGYYILALNWHFS